MIVRGPRPAFPPEPPWRHPLGRSSPPQPSSHPLPLLPLSNPPRAKTRAPAECERPRCTCTLPPGGGTLDSKSQKRAPAECERARCNCTLPPGGGALDSKSQKTRPGRVRTSKVQLHFGKVQLHLAPWRGGSRPRCHVPGGGTPRATWSVA